MINIEKKEKCCGCNACYNICPVKAIKMKEDKEGFKYPVIDKKICINCGLCEKVCPIINDDNKNSLKDNIYAAWSKDESIRLDSTSGGIFSELAKKIIENDGYICGAVYDSNWMVKHYITNDINDLGLIRSSKYIQSDLGIIHKQIKEKLEEGSEVLFCGSPCQVKGLLGFLQKKYENLITIDFICRGMNSPKIFKMYLEDLKRKYESEIENIKFKNKDRGWNNFSTKIDFKNGKTYMGGRYLDSFMIGYLKYNAFMRPACYECGFKGKQRASDITLADFWGIEKIDETLNDNKGTSMVIVNTKKGQDLLSLIKDNIYIKKIDSEFVFTDNKTFEKSVDRTDSREKVFDNIDKMTYKELSNNFFRSPKGIDRLKKKIKYSKLYFYWRKK